MVAWIDSELESLTPWHTDGVTSPASLQRFAELAIAYDVLDDSPLQLPSLAVRWKPFLTSHLADPAFAELARSRLDWAWALLLPYLVMRKRGLISDYHDATLRYSRRAGFPYALEVVPYRALDYEYFAEASGLPAANRDSSVSLLARTFAARASCRYLVDSQSAYALTHAIFYASSFGRTSLSRHTLPNAAKIVDSMIVDCCTRQEFDLLGELLICSIVLPQCRTAVRELGLSLLRTALDDSGCVLPNGRVTEPGFDQCYHPTLVGLILCASLAQLRS